MHCQSFALCHLGLSKETPLPGNLLVSHDFRRFSSFAISGGHVIFKHTHLHSLGSKSRPHARHWSAPCRATPPTWAHLMGRHGKPWASARPMATQLAEPKSWRFWSVSSFLKPWSIGCHCAAQKKNPLRGPLPHVGQINWIQHQPANRGRNIRVAPGLARTLTLQGAAAMQTQIPRFNGLHLSCLQGASWFMTYHTLWVQHLVRHSWGHLLSNSRIFNFWWLGLAQYSHKSCKHNLWNSASHNQLHGQTTPQFPLNLTFMPNTYITPWSTKRPPAQCCLRKCLPRKLWVPFWVPALDRTRINGCFNLIWFTSPCSTDSTKYLLGVIFSQCFHPKKFCTGLCLWECHQFLAKCWEQQPICGAGDLMLLKPAGCRIMLFWFQNPVMFEWLCCLLDWSDSEKQWDSN